MPNPNLERARAFLACRRLALVGASRDPRSFSRTVQRALVARGYDVVAVNPAASGDAGSVARVSDARPAPEAALLMTPPAHSAEAVRDCLAAGVRRIWFHRGGGAGSSSPKAVALCRAAGVEPVVDLCPFMVLPGAGVVHKLHAFFRTRRAEAAAR
jgi:predicted CoA-binding protein